MLGFLVGLHVFFAILLIVVILMQQSQGAGMSSVFGGGGGGGSFFGGRGASPLLKKITIGLAVMFFVTSSSIAVIVPHTQGEGSSDIDQKLKQTLPQERGIPREQLPGQQRTQGGQESPVEMDQEGEGMGEGMLPLEENSKDGSGELPIQNEGGS